MLWGHKFPRSEFNQDDTITTHTGKTVSESASPHSIPDVTLTPSTPGAHLGAFIPPPRPTNILDDAKDFCGLKYVRAFLADVTIENNATWMDIAQDPPSFESEVGAINSATWMAATLDLSSFEPQVGVTAERSKNKSSVTSYSFSSLDPLNNNSIF